MTRTFEDKPATRDGGVPLLIGLMGPSGSGKTFSALRLAKGIQRVSGGDVFCVDTEARRSLHYSDQFKFQHLEFVAPFGSLDYLAAIEHCAKKGAGVIIVDSLSHEHEGPGGMLEQHEEECQRLMKAWGARRDAVQFAAWQKPKSDRQRLINSILQTNVNFIFCFRAKEKLKLVQGKKGKEPKSQGFMPIAAPEMVYEMTVNALLMPNAGGVPTWQSSELGERQMIKLPEQFKRLFSGQSGPLNEDAGEAMARWAAGDTNQAFQQLSAAIASASTLAELESLVPRLKDSAKLCTGSESKQLRTAYGAQQKALAAKPAETHDDGYREDFE